jgi:hypothetical protein
MGRMLGSFADENELDRPDLNKCPDCKCYFAGDNCPLCGKPCPEEMRAGNRKPVKAKKHPNRNQSGRVTFIPWYHTWWFILVMLFAFPLAGIVLLATSPYKKWLIGVVIAGAVLIVISILFTFFGHLLFPYEPVDTSLSREEYVATCMQVTPQAYYRAPDQYIDEYVTMTMVVVDKIMYGETTYYVCQDPENAKYEIYLCEYIISGDENFAVGETITIYGEGAGICTLFDEYDDSFTVPCINLAYAVLVEEE